MRTVTDLLRNRSGAAAAEMALVLPLLILIMMGSFELGNYFMNEHSLAKAVRNGARFAARQPFTNYTSCSGEPGGTVAADTRNVVMRGYMSGGTIITPNIEATDIDIETSCSTVAGGQTMGGIYTGRTDGAQIVTVTASVDYRPILGVSGFTGVGFRLNAESEAAVAGL